MVLAEKELKKKGDRIAIIRCATPHKITLKPNETADIPAYADRQVRYPTTTALLEESEEANIPDFVDVSPATVSYSFGQRKDYTVILSNLTKTLY